MQLVRDIRFWIIIFFLVRMIGINMPPVEVTHNWRQSTGLMVARNFYEIDANILYPRLDNGGNKTGITGTEFPLFNYLIYLAAKIFGWADWYGRLINLIVSSIGVYFFYRLVAKYFDPKTAFYSTIALLLSSWILYSRKTMPDTFSTSLILISIWYALEYLFKGRWWQLLLFTLFAAAGTLSKIPAGYLLPLLGIPIFFAKIPFSRKALLVLCLVPIAIANWWWYFIWVNYLNAKFGFWHYYMGSPLLEGMKEVLGHLSRTFRKFYFSAIHYVGFGLTLVGIGVAVYKKQKLLLLVFLLSFVVFIFFIFKAGYAFYYHDYYILPFVPVMALMVGYTLSSINQPILRGMLILALSIDCIDSQYTDFYLREDRLGYTKLESIADQVSSRKDLIVVNGDENPMELYMAHRKGWVIRNDDARDTVYMDSLAGLGAKYLFINRHEFSEDLPYRAVLKDKNYWIYRLDTRNKTLTILLRR